jgi:glycosyltransferase involved in cell wall biosynthesis
VKFLGLLSNYETLTYFKKNSILLFPSFDETFGLSILESMSQGCVPVCSCLPQISEWFTDNDNGFLVETGDIEDFVSKINELINNSDLFFKMSFKNVKYSQEFLASKKVPEYLKVYADLV